MTLDLGTYSVAPAHHALYQVWASVLGLDLRRDVYLPCEMMFGGDS